jgi:hypothetical protein
MPEFSFHMHFHMDLYIYADYDQLMSQRTGTWDKRTELCTQKGPKNNETNVTKKDWMGHSM